VPDIFSTAVAPRCRQMSFWSSASDNWAAVVLTRSDRHCIRLDYRCARELYEPNHTTPSVSSEHGPFPRFRPRLLQPALALDSLRADSLGRRLVPLQRDHTGSDLPSSSCADLQTPTSLSWLAHWRKDSVATQGWTSDPGSMPARTTSWKVEERRRFAHHALKRAGSALIWRRVRRAGR